MVGFRWLYDFFMRLQRSGAAEPFTLTNELTTLDNPAIAIDFASFLFAMCFVTRGSLYGLKPGIESAKYFYTFWVYQAVGCVVILVARVLNDKLMLRSVNNIKAMVDDRSVAVACVTAGTTVATAFIFAASCGGGEATFGEGLLLSLLYWLIGQVLLLSYANIVDCVTSLPVAGLVEAGEGDGAATTVFKEVGKGNVAAGLSVGLDLVHAGILIAAPIYVGYGILPWVIFVGSALGVVSPIMYLYLDYIVLRNKSYTINILRNQNWGAAALIGALKVLLALVLMSSYSENCSPASLYASGPCVVDLPTTFVSRLGAVAIPNVFTIQTLSNLIILLFVIAAAKALCFLRFAMKDGLGEFSANRKTFSLDAQLADPDNNAIAVSLAAYTLSQGLTIVGVVRCPSDQAGLHFLETLLWTFIGCVLLLLAYAINDCILLMKVSNTEELLKNNVAIAAFEGGSFLACGIILRGSLTGGGDYNMGEGLLLTVLYWAISQLLLIVIAYIYRAITFFDDWDELKKGNVAAGVSGGITLVALAVIMAYPIPMYVSLLIFVPIALVGILALMILRKIVDLAVLPGNALDREIKDDKNWGAAIIEGGCAVGIAFIMNMYVPTPGNELTWDVCD